MFRGQWLELASDQHSSTICRSMLQSLQAGENPEFTREVPVEHVVCVGLPVTAFFVCCVCICLSVLEGNVIMGVNVRMDAWLMMMCVRCGCV